MFRLATCQDLTRLRMKEPKDLLQNVYLWGLKQMGYLFVKERFKEHFPELQVQDSFLEEKNHTQSMDKIKILEVGAGLSSVFYKLFGNVADYWIADKAGFYDKDKLETALKERPKATLVDTFMGDFHKGLPDRSFDYIFSVSVLEHTPMNKLMDSVTDMNRVLKPGGLFVHSVDIGRDDLKFINEFKQCVEKNNFEWLEQPQELDFTKDGLLYEPLFTKFLHYRTAMPGARFYRFLGIERANEERLKCVSTHTGTVLVCARST